jgi:hypothetical protein
MRRESPAPNPQDWTLLAWQAWRHPLLRRGAPSAFLSACPHLPNQSGRTHAGHLAYDRCCAAFAYLAPRPLAPRPTALSLTWLLLSPVPRPSHIALTAR